jgi:hypothetical protein
VVFALDVVLHLLALGDRLERLDADLHMAILTTTTLLL